MKMSRIDRGKVSPARTLFGAALALLLAGGGLLLAQWINVPVLPSVQALRHMEKVRGAFGR